jgi:hypothetical protein
MVFGSCLDTIAVPTALRRAVPTPASGIQGLWRAFCAHAVILTTKIVHALTQVLRGSRDVFVYKLLFDSISAWRSIYPQLYNEFTLFYGYGLTQVYNIRISEQKTLSRCSVFIFSKES